MDRLLEYLQRHPFLVALLGAALLAVLAFELRARRLGYAAIQPQEAIQLMNQGAPVYDLRAADAFAGGHITGARSLPPAQHESAPETLKKYREKLLILYCDTGASAGDAVRKLHAAGFTKVFNLRGGLNAWRAESLPLVRT
jgi:rhodanese-related sulfurtransferase